jgi:Lar family restriction alleviation protein
MPDMDKPVELKPCPFCGGTNIYADHYNHTAGLRWRVVCLNCMAMVDPGWFQQKYMAIDAWNRRRGEQEAPNA